MVFICGMPLGVNAQETEIQQPTFQRPLPKFLPKGELRVGINPEQPPLIFIQNNRIMGLEADLARAFAKDLGVPLNFVVMEFEELIPALVAGKIDIIMSGMSETEVRSIKINFATPYLATGQMPLVRASDLTRYPTTMALLNTQVRVGVEEGTTGDFYVRENFRYCERIPFKDIQAASDALAAERLGMVIADAPTVWWLAAEREAAGLAPVRALLSRELISWGISKTNPDLQMAADSFLVHLQGSGQLDQMIGRWLPYLEAMKR
ncbi:MAG: transporter substrate-binding domain-containing protein [Verrucomicrobiota bacterium]